MIRTSDAALLARELRSVRAITLALFDAYEAAGLLDVPCRPEFNLPLWELGHVGWFQQWWVGRNQQRARGVACEPDHARLPCTVMGLPHHGDAWYDSTTVAHAARWQLPLLNAAQTRRYLAASLEHTLGCLQSAGSSSDALYFYRLVLLHEAMHAEAAVYMAQALAQPIQMPVDYLNTMNSIALHANSTPAIHRFSLKKQLYTLAGEPSGGFAFDNELGSHEVALDAFEIDSRPVSWQQYVSFVRETGYALPAHVRPLTVGYEQLYFGRWQPLNLQASAVHLSWYDAQAYCLWAGRTLPTEAQWECAMTQEPLMVWGDVWEWTATDFQPYPGFIAHPYRDYSEPWFGSRKVLRGACAATLPLMKNARYRNYFTPDRTDIYAGFRTCAL